MSFPRSSWATCWWLCWLAASAVNSPRSCRPAFRRWWLVWPMPWPTDITKLPFLISRKGLFILRAQKLNMEKLWSILCILPLPNKDIYFHCTGVFKLFHCLLLRWAHGRAKHRRQRNEGLVKTLRKYISILDPMTRVVVNSWCYWKTGSAP